MEPGSPALQRLRQENQNSGNPGLHSKPVSKRKRGGEKREAGKRGRREERGEEEGRRGERRGIEGSVR